jgi:flagellar basal-body rod modification protein FlgD
MPGIGNPNRPKNTFGNIKKYDGPKKGQNANQKGDVGKQLNRISGNEEESKFVKKEDHNKMDKDAFLRLLSNQLANQDPFKPVDQKKFAADMAQFAQLEQMTNMNSNLNKNATNKDSQDKFMAASFIGKAVKTSGTTIPYDGKKPVVDLPFHLDKPASKVMIRVFDSSNNMISQIERDSMGAGANSVAWNGKQMDGVRATSETYRFEVRAYDEKFQPFKGKTLSEGLVTGVSFENGETILTVDGGKKVFLRDVDSFSMAKPSLNAATNSGLKKNANAAYNKMEQATL